MKGNKKVGVKSISVVVPVFNEAGNVVPLHEELTKVLSGIKVDSKIIFVDDGSTDDTRNELRGLSGCKIITFDKNYGKSAALHAALGGIDSDVVVIIDGDLQNDPADIPKLLEKIEEGFDVAAGWRQKRWEGQFISRKLPSVVANWLISFVSGVWLHDHGCALKAYRRNFLDGVPLQDDMQRMLSIFVANKGGRVVEVPINYRPRKFGHPKFGAERIMKVPLDVISMYFFDRYSKRPMHFFGGAGLISWFLGVVLMIWAIALRVFAGVHLSRTPLISFVVMFAMVGFQFVLLGLLSELIIRNSTGKEIPYHISGIAEPGKING